MVKDNKMIKQHEIRHNGEQWELIDLKTAEIVVTGTYFDCNSVLCYILPRKA